MPDPNEVAFLRAIAETGDDNTPRLAFADRLDENGDPARAEFVRVQCELATPGVADAARLALRVRERELLTAHRKAWCDGFGVPVEDVLFERGFVSRVRLARWRRAFLDPTVQPLFATATELDLSGLRLGDAAVRAFAEAARLPALRKLLLSGNGITDAGAESLANATGMPRLETVYLFGNALTDGGAPLYTAKGFRLSTLDTGERADGYSMTRGETDVARRGFVRDHLLPTAAKYFEKFRLLRSGVMCVAQYWCDEAIDAVHAQLVVSELFEPTLTGVRHYDEDETADPNIPNSPVTGPYQSTPSSAVYLDGPWDSNGQAIPAWACYAAEEGSQEYSALAEVYSPAVMVYPHGGYEFLPMPRPHLDGVRPEEEYG